MNRRQTTQNRRQALPISHRPWSALFSRLSATPKPPLVHRSLGEGGYPHTLILFIFLLLLVLPAAADLYIVKKNGIGIWAKSAKKDGDQIVYVAQASGKTLTFPFSELEATVPAVKRGTHYDPKTVETYITRIKKLRKRHYGLNRALTQLLQEWKALQTTAKDFGPEIDQLATDFKTSSKDAPIYRKTVMSLGMIKYKDVHGKHLARIDKLLEEMKKDYVTTNMARLQAMAKANPMKVDAFVRLHLLGRDILDAATQDEKRTVEALVKTCRKRAFDQNITLAATGFVTAKQSIDGYLAARDILHRVKKEVADTPEQKSRIDTSVAQLEARVSRAHPGYRFNYKGFPLDKNDFLIFGRTADYGSRITYPTLTIDEQCFVLPKTPPTALRVRQAFKQPLRLIFNRAQPADRVYGLVVMLNGKNGAHTHLVKLGPLKIEKGHVDVVYAENFATLPAGFALSPDDENPAIFVHVAIVEEDKELGPEALTAISLICGWPIR